MKRIIAVFLACIMLCMMPGFFAVFAASYTEETEEFYDDFSSGMSKWTVSSGTDVVSVSNEALFLSGSDFADTVMVYAGESWSDIVYQSDFSISNSGGYFGWYFRYSANDHYLMQFYPTNQLKLLKRVTRLGSGYTEIASCDITLLQGQSYTMRIEAQGSHIKAYLDDTEVLAANDSDVSSGKIGVRSLKQKVTFDNVSVTVKNAYEYEYGVNKTLFLDSFEEDNTGRRWTSVNGDSLSDALDRSQGTTMVKLNANDGGEKLFFAKNIACDDCIVSADMAVVKGGTAGLIFRYADEKNHYFLQYAEEKLTLYKKVESFTYEKIGEAAYAMDKEYVYRMKADLNGSTIKIYIDDIEILSVNDTSLASGKIGLYVQNGEAYFDNVVAYSGIEPQQLPAKTIKIILPVDVSGITKFYYVSPDGDDSNSGSIEAPFQTMTRAKEEIERAGVPDGGVCVYFREGEYYMPTGEYFYSSRNGGREGSPVVYSSYPGERAVFTGAISLDKNTMVPISEEIASRLPVPERVLAFDLTENGISVLEEMLPSGYSYRQNVANYELYYGDEKLTLARWPNNQYLKTGKIIERGSRPGFGETTNQGFTFVYDANRPTYWEDTEDIWMSGAWSREWAYSNIKIDTIDAQNGTITTVHPSPYGAEEGMPYYYYNILEELDVPGEWYLDRENKILYVYPPGELEDVSLSFTYNSYVFFRLANTSNIVFQNIDISRTRDSAVNIAENTENIVMQGCRISNIGSNGITMIGRNSGFLNGEIVNAGSIGIALGSSVDDRKALVNAGNFCHNSYIENCGKVTYSYLANVSGVGNIFTNNIVRDGYAGGIGFGGNENLVAYNEISEVCKLVNDGGAIYSAGRDFTQRGNRICYNYIHDVNASQTSLLSGPSGIYLDAMSSGNFVEGNTIVNVTHPLLIGGGRENTIVGNLILDQTAQSKSSFTFDQRGTDTDEYEDQGTVWDRLVDVLHNAYDTMPCQSEAWASKYPRLRNVWSDEPQKPKYNVIAGNFVYNHKNSSIFPQVKDTGSVQENITLTDTNCFQNYNEKDFSIKPDADIYETSSRLKETEFYRTGIYTDGYYWTQKKSIADFYLTYPTEKMTRDEQYLAWSAAEGADRYSVEIAEDFEFNELVFHTNTENNYVDISDLHRGKTYFWRVTARSRAKSFSDALMTSNVGTFATLTEEELLELTIKDAKEIYNTAINAESMEFERTDLNDFRTLISEIENRSPQASVTDLHSRLQSGISEFLVSNKNPEISFADDFSTLNAGASPVGYQRADAGIEGILDGSEKCLVLNDSSTSSYPALIKQVDNITGRARIEFRIKPKQQWGSTLNIKLRGTNGVVYQDPIVFSFDNFYVKADGENVMFFSKDTWYHFTLDVDLLNGVYSLSVNDTPKITEKSFSKVGYLNQLVFTGGPSATGQFYIDDIVIKGNNGTFRSIYDKYMAAELCASECVVRKDGRILNLSGNEANGFYYLVGLEGKEGECIFMQPIAVPAGEMVLPDFLEYTKAKAMFWNDKFMPLSAAKVIVG